MDNPTIFTQPTTQRRQEYGENMMKYWYNTDMTVTLLTFLGWYISSSLFIASAVVVDAAAGGVTVINSIEDELTYDDNDRLAKHTFVYDASSSVCQSMVPKTIGRRVATTPYETTRYDIVGVDGHAFDKVFGPYNKIQEVKKNPDNTPGCVASCLQRGTPKNLAAAVMPQMIYDSTVVGKQQQSLEEWFSEHCSKVEVCLVNYHSKTSPLKIYWKDVMANQERFLMDLEWGERKTRCFESFIGHQLVAKDESGEDDDPVVVGEVTIEFTTVKAFGNSPPSDERAPAHDFEKEIESTLRFEWKRHK